MTYPRAREVFEAVAGDDPRCAMAYWGVAMTLFQPLWPTRPGPAELARGWEAVQRATALRAGTERERLFLEAAAEFFRDPQGSVVPGVTVTISSRASTEGARPDASIGFRRTARADDRGFFRVLEIPPGFYTITTDPISG